MSADLIARLFESGTPPALVAEVAMALGRLEAERDAAATADRRSPSAVKQQRYRDRIKAAAEVTNVTKGNDVTSVTPEVTAAPSPDKSPPHPQKLTPTPCVSDTPAREGLGVSVHVRLAGAQLAAAVLLTGLAELQRKRWKDMPPPAGISAEQWHGFIDHRKAKRQALTPRAYQLLCRKLAAHSDDEWPPGRIIDHIVERGWLSFEPEWLQRKVEQRNGKRPHPANDGDLINPMAAAAARYIARGDGGAGLDLD